ncbi:MAG: polysaccharide biosynthesis protein PelA, partial [Thermoleophilaceae bacterium]|nr:polysaccharide biosynthesis protein PelA [Thermoleophilaceae bacterium]
RLITRRVAPALMRKGFDGLFLDNVDMVETHPGRRAGMRVLVRTLARGRELLFAQNGEGFEGGLARYLDGWNREDVTSTYDFGRRSYTRTSAQARRDAQAELRRMAARGLLVTATDYVAAGDSAGESDSVAGACAAGALPYVADIGLTRVPASPFTCP